MSMILTNNFLIENDLNDDKKTREMLFHIAFSAAEKNHQVQYVTGKCIDELPKFKFNYDGNTLSKVHFRYVENFTHQLLKFLLQMRHYIPKLVIIELDELIKPPINSAYLDNYAFFISTIHTMIRQFSKVRINKNETRNFNSLICYKRTSDALDIINDFYFKKCNQLTATSLAKRMTNPNFLQDIFSL